MIILKFNLIHIYFWLIKNIYIPKLRFKGFDNQYNKIKLCDVLFYEQPTKYIVKSDEYNDSFDTPVLTANKSFILGKTDEKTGIYSKGPVIIFDDFTTENKYVDFDFKVKSSAIKFLTTDSKNNLFYLYQLININPFTINGHNRHWIRFSSQEIKWICSLEEQEKISKFFSLLDQQILLLENKLQLIEQKFEYFLNYLFNKKTFNGKKALTLLKEISVIIKGDQINSSKLKESGLYYYQNGGIEPSGWLDDFNRGKNTISINEGGSCGIVKWHDLPFWSGGHLYTLEIKNKILINNKYLYYLLKCNEKKITKLQKGSSLKNIQKKDLEKMNISYLTNINEQILIVKFLNVIEKQKELLRKKINFLIIKKKYFLTKIFI